MRSSSQQGEDKDDVELSHLAWLIKRRKELGKLTWRSMFCTDSMDPLRTDRITDLKNALELS